MAYKRKNRRLTEALTTYQEALVSEATVVAEEQAIAKAAVKDLKLDIDAPAEGELYDIKEVTEAVEEKVAALDQAVRAASNDTVSPDEALTPEAIAFANQILADLETVAQKQVDALKAKNAAVVNLQQKVLDYNNTAKEINVNVIEFNSAMGVLSTNNDGTSTVGGAGKITASGFDSAEDFKVSVSVWKEDGAQGMVELSFDKNGNLVVEGFSATDLRVVDAARDDLDKAITKVVDLAEALESANSELAEAKTELAAAETTAADAAAALTTADAELADAQADLDAATDVNDAIKDVDAIDGENAQTILTALAGVEGDALVALKDALDALDADDPDYDEANAALADAKAEANGAVTSAQAGVDAKTIAQATAAQADADAKQAVIDAQADFDAKTIAQATAAEADADPAAKQAVADAQEALDALLTPSDDVVVDLFNNLEGVEDFIASVEALYGNIAAQAAAAAAVDAAILNSLKKAGYKVYEEGETKAVAWSNVKVEDGKLVNADEKETKTFVLKALDSEGKALTYGKEKTLYDEVEIGDELVKLPAINAGNGNITGSADVKLPDMPNVIEDAAEASEDALKELDKAQQNIADFNKAVDAYNAAVETEKALENAAADVKAAAEAVAEAEGAFEELGFNLVKAVDGVADGTAFDENAEDQAADLFVYGESKLTVENFDGQDVLYFGDKAADLITITKAQAESAAGKVGGEASVLDIFAYQDGANTILLVEKEAFAGNASGAVTDNPDLVEVTLTGVNVADLSFEDGFLAFA